MAHDTSVRRLDQGSLFEDCAYCGALFVPKSAKSKHCSERCRYRTRERTRMAPCAVCGEPMHMSRNSLPVGQAAHRRCRFPDGANHGRASTYDRGCRCDECRAAKAAAVREWTRKHNYWSRPEVVAARKSRRSSESAREAEKRRWGRYYRENREQLIVAYKAKEVRRKGAPTIPFTVAQLEDRLSMYAGCWICGCALGERFHVDHVKPLARGGWHCLSNLRPSCPSCNISKGAKWPLSELGTLRDSSRG